MESLFSLFLSNLALAAAVMFFLWILSLVKKDAGVGDIFWGVGFVLIAWFTYFLTEGYGARKILIVSLTTIWGFRLSVHIFMS